jgi:hypothetical protein
MNKSVAKAQGLLLCIFNCLRLFLGVACGTPRFYEQPRRTFGTDRLCTQCGRNFKVHKRHIVTDTENHLVGSHVDAADIQNRDGAVSVPASFHSLYRWLRRVFVDRGCADDGLRDTLSLDSGLVRS